MSLCLWPFLCVFMALSECAVRERGYKVTTNDRVLQVRIPFGAEGTHTRVRRSIRSSVFFCVLQCQNLLLGPKSNVWFTSLTGQEYAN